MDRPFKTGVLVGALIVVTLATIAVCAWGTMSSPAYGSVYARVAVPLTLARDIRNCADQDCARAVHFAQFRNNGASRGVYSWQFGDEAQEDEVGFQVIAPRGREFGPPIHPFLFVTPEDATVCDYRVCIEFLLVQPGEAIPASTSAICATFASPAAQTYHRVNLGEQATSHIEELDSMLYGRLYRNSSHAEDTCNGKFLWIHGGEVMFKMDRAGSRTEWAK